MKTGGEGRALGAEIWGKSRSPGWKVSRGTPHAVHSSPPPPRRAALAPAVHPPDTLRLVWGGYLYRLPRNPPGAAWNGMRPMRRMSSYGICRFSGEEVHLLPGEDGPAFASPEPAFVVPFLVLLPSGRDRRLVPWPNLGQSPTRKLSAAAGVFRRACERVGARPQAPSPPPTRRRRRRRRATTCRRPAGRKAGRPTWLHGPTETPDVTSSARRC